MAQKALWRCPKCGRWFANRHQEHSCGSYSVEDFLRGKSPAAVALFQRFVELVQSCGDVLIAPAKTRVGFQG
jgi:ABC-type ATPase with predicted acetyltransferase domain